MSFLRQIARSVQDLREPFSFSINRKKKLGTTKMTFSLHKCQKEDVKRIVQAGYYHSDSELFRDVIDFMLKIEKIRYHPMQLGGKYRTHTFALAEEKLEQVNQICGIKSRSTIFRTMVDLFLYLSFPNLLFREKMEFKEDLTCG